MSGLVWGEIISCCCVEYGLSRMVELIALGEILVMRWQIVVVGIGTMVE